jgi:hypothetical protein
LWVAGHLLGSARGSRAGDGGLAIANFCIFNASLARHSLGDGGNESTAACCRPVLAFVERCDTLSFLEIA